RAGATPEELAELIASAWRRRDDRGAEQRLQLANRSALLPTAELKRDPHLEMHTRGGGAAPPPGVSRSPPRPGPGGEPPGPRPPRADRRQRLHPHARLSGDPGARRDDGAAPRSGPLERDVHVDRLERERVAERNDLGGALGRLDSREPRHGERVALGELPRLGRLECPRSPPDHAPR